MPHHVERRRTPAWTAARTRPYQTGLIRSGLKLASSAYKAYRASSNGSQSKANQIAEWRPLRGPTSSTVVSKFGGTNKANQGKAFSYLKYGAGYQNTISGTAQSTADSALYIGHTTHPGWQLAKAVCASLLRRAYQKLGVDLGRGTDVVPIHSFATNAGFYYSGRTDDQLGNVELPGFLPGTSTVNDIALEMTRAIFRLIWGFFDASAAGIIPVGAVTWHTFYLRGQTSATAGCQIPLSGLQVMTYVSSKMKLQNATVPGQLTTTPDIDLMTNVSNIPLEGYHYKGSGTHMLLKGVDHTFTFTASNEPSFVSDRISGLMRKNPNGPDTGRALSFDAPKPFQFQRCSRGAKVRLDPGHIKTDYMDQETVTTWQVFFEKLFSGGSNAQPPQSNQESGVVAKNWSTHGKFSTFGLERTINWGGNSDHPITVRYEIYQEVYGRIGREFKQPGICTINQQGFSFTQI